MKFRFVAPALLAAVFLACTSGSARAGLFSHGLGGCGCGSSCGAPDVVWGASCAPQPSWCGGGHGCGSCFGHGLFARLRACRPHRLLSCCDPCGAASCEPACGAEPTCGAAVACEPTCGATVDCEPACGAPAAFESACGSEPSCCAPACEPSCKPRCGGFLRRLFHHSRHASCCDSACDFGGGDVSCGCEPSCGCN
jgi:hypothetical protein